jgi:hypothetical protein
VINYRRRLREAALLVLSALAVSASVLWPISYSFRSFVWVHRKCATPSKVTGTIVSLGAINGVMVLEVIKYDTAKGFSGVQSGQAIDVVFQKMAEMPAGVHASADKFRPYSGAFAVGLVAVGVERSPVTGWITAGLPLWWMLLLFASWPVSVAIHAWRKRVGRRCRGFEVLP